MKAQWLRGVSMLGYGVSLSVGIGIPIPVLNEDVALSCAVKDEDIFAQVVDYGQSYPQGAAGSLGEVNYGQLKSGKITVNGKDIPTGALSSYSKAKEISEELKLWIKQGEFLLSEPVTPLPGVESGYTVRPLKERPV
jgi:uncharacterized protein (DUF39 family)